MSKHFIVVTYDLTNNKRRTKLHKLLQDYGTPVQYSVFECLLEPKEIEQMKRRVRRLIKPSLDQVRYYPLCATCQGRIETTAASVEVVKEADVWVV
jgi:CRISPR-associated protein Cas2